MNVFKPGDVVKRIIRSNIHVEKDNYYIVKNYGAVVMALENTVGYHDPNLFTLATMKDYLKQELKIN